MDLNNLDDVALKKIYYEIRAEVSQLNNTQMSLKILLNSLYGSLANKYGRYFDIRLASAITLSGQLSIRWIEEYLMNHKLQKKYGWEIIYSDTDSAYIHLNQLVIKLKEKYPKITDLQITEKLDSFYKKVLDPIIKEGYKELKEYMNTPENKMFMARETISSKAFWTGKKKYAMLVIDDEGVRYENPELKVKGIEIVRSSTPKVVRKSLKKAVRFILEDIDKFYEYIASYRKEFDKFSPEEIAFPRGVNNMAKYIDGNSYKKGTPIALRASFAYNNFIKKHGIQQSFSEIMTGEKIKFVYMKMPNPVFENVFGFLSRMPIEKDLPKYVDYDMMYDKTFMSVINNICKHLNINTNINKNNINDLF